jgi:hypothetical protein
MLKLTLISAVLLGIGFAGIAIKIWAKKDGEFDGTCSSRNATGKGCACGGGGGACQNTGDHHHDHDHHHDEIPKISVKKIA